MKKEWMSLPRREPTMNKELVSFIESSKISPLLLNPSITDVSFNGISLFYQDNLKGRKKSDIKLTALP